MGLVVEFGLPVVRSRRQKPDRPCEVTIFPGVRYERMAEAYVGRDHGDDRRPGLSPLGADTV